MNTKYVIYKNIYLHATTLPNIRFLVKSACSSSNFILKNILKKHQDDYKLSNVKDQEVFEF